MEPIDRFTALFTTDAQSFFIVVPILARPRYHGLGWVLDLVRGPQLAQVIFLDFATEAPPDFVISKLDLGIKHLKAVYCPCCRHCGSGCSDHEGDADTWGHPGEES